jgi:hypothetical protein
MTDTTKDCAEQIMAAFWAASRSATRRQQVAAALKAATELLPKDDTVTDTFEEGVQYGLITASKIFLDVATELETEISNTIKWEVEYTDTFGGEANYSWVKRAEFEMPDSATNNQITKKAKAAIGLTGVRCSTVELWDGFQITPINSCTTVFVRSVI